MQILSQLKKAQNEGKMWIEKGIVSDPVRFKMNDGTN